jgi:hypothetical protein
MIIDTHQHFWNIERPWAKGVQDYRILAEPEGITGTILRLEENEAALEIADREPFVVGVCGEVIPGPAFEGQYPDTGESAQHAGQYRNLGASCRGKGFNGSRSIFH